MGPVLVVGDWNCPADSFEAVRLLGSNYGFADLAALWSERTGSPLEPTCAGATRHSFAFGNTEVQRFLGPVEVRHPFDLDKHAVLVVDVQFPRANPTVLRWLRPQPLADLVPDVERLSCLGGEVLPKLAESVRTSLAAHRPDEALLSWASTVEQVVCDAAEVDGQTRRAFVGRCSTDGPVAMSLAPPRVRFGRPGDVASPLLSLTLQQRRWLRQVRRLKALLKLLEAMEVRGMLTGDLARVGALWRAVLASPGFGHSFRNFLQVRGYFVPSAVPGAHWLREVGSFLESALQDLCRQLECKKKRMFVADLEENWKNQGGSLPFRLISDEQPDAITAVTIRTHVLLAAQRWSPLGLEWIKVQSVVGLPVGQVLDGLRRVVIRAVEAPFIQLDARLTRREAASLYLDVSSADPQDWAPHFLSGWNRYWQRDDAESLTVEHRALLDLIPERDEAPLSPLTFDDWHRAVSRTKHHTMPDVDGFSQADLALLPPPLVQPLLRIFSWVEADGSWPKLLCIWLVVLLRKVPSGPVTWDLIRPISVAGLLYRVWSKMRTAAMVRHAESLASETVRSRCLWGLELDLIDHFVAARRPCSGFVLDILKAFNVVHRGLLRGLLRRLGFPGPVVQAWFKALACLRRQVLVGGWVYGDECATTGIPEGDPLSVVGVYVLAILFRAIVHRFDADVLVLTYADNWEVLLDHFDRLPPLVDHILRVMDVLVVVLVAGWA